MDDEHCDIKCPFCGEDGFDLIGLKDHLLHYDCKEFTETPTAGYRLLKPPQGIKKIYR